MILFNRQLIVTRGGRVAGDSFFYGFSLSVGKMKEGNGISQELESTSDIIRGMGFEVVEAQYRPTSARPQVSIFIYRETGVSLKDCTDIYRTVMPRLEVVLDNRDINLEISSPGISRNIKYFGEFSIFRGRRVRIMPTGNNDWIEGIIQSADESSVLIAAEDGEIRYEREDIVKAKISEG